MKVLICLVSLIAVSSATFGKLSFFGGGTLNSLLGGLGGQGASGYGGGRTLTGSGGGGGSAVQENYVSILDQLGPGTVIERGTLRKRIPKTDASGIGGEQSVGFGSPVSGGAYSVTSNGVGAQHGQVIKVIDEGLVAASGPGTIVNVYGDASGGFGNGAEASHGGYTDNSYGKHLSGGSNGGVTVIRVIHEHAGASGAGYAEGYKSVGHSDGSAEAVKVFKIIENSSYGSDGSSSGSFINTASGAGYSSSGNGGWAPISGQNGW